MESLTIQKLCRRIVGYEWICIVLANLLNICLWRKFDVYILSEANDGSGSNDGNLPINKSFPWVDSFDLHLRYLIDFIDFRALDSS